MAWWHTVIHCMLKLYLSARLGVVSHVINWENYVPYEAVQRADVCSHGVLFVDPGPAGGGSLFADRILKIDFIMHYG